MSIIFKNMKKLFPLKSIVAAGLITIVATTAISAITPKGESKLNPKRYINGKYLNTVAVKDFTASEYLDMTWKFFFGSNNGRVPNHPLPTVEPKAFGESASSAIQYNWLGHSSLILEIEGKRLLLDPVFSERTSPTQLFGPKRFHPVPIQLTELPPIDMILVSHNHYDHLDKLVVDHYKNSDVRFIVPMGIKSLLIKWGVASENITELDWWDEYKVDGLTVASTPARHFSGRGLFDKDEALWTSWAIVGNSRRVYFSGDTGMTPEFDAIGKKYGPFDITFIKMGAYDEMWPDIHLNPEQAVEAHIMLKGKQLVPIHWGTFDLAFHPWQEPIERMIKAADKAGIALLTSGIGETVIPGEHQNTYWWRSLGNK